VCVLPLAPPDPPTGQAGASGSGLASQLSAGLRFLRHDADAGLLVLVVGMMVAFANMAVVAEVAFAESVLGAGPTGYSVLVAAWSVGMLAGTLAGGRLPERRLALATLIGTLATGAGVALAGTAAVLWQAAAAYAFGGLANGLEVVATRSFLNHRAPPQVAGRVFAVYSGVLFGAASLGMAAAGALLGSLNPRLVLFLAGGGGLVAAGVGALFYARHHVRAGRPPRPRPAPARDAPAERSPAPGAPPVAAPPGRAAHGSAPAVAAPPPGLPADQPQLSRASDGRPPTAPPDRADRG
jgi:MFS family permease